ncbi:MAG: XylR N-terminal domain-containing protein [Alphaproteobacteria bacterium]|nr:XylR N-terminal domain-containing protein [Alphaproteobacteria bacterium]MBU1279974.1 XylR N-terminal domain-containing protein [Alphaproteobacteria bacterium]MBU1573513.1 XylR N-terminal domain-containing protein [Alphaproteobacteria bacterium]MBU1828701.1 XylR N-terminal domain-containing protein [Alphaproteobacteria bacterium]MBU2079509.1 XylR N-terminal domain-containing protein [Alphaproteobacteria bacterium]
MKTPNDEETLLHRGGRPTLADLIDTLEFSPSKGAIELHGARMVLSRATFGADLQDELVRRFGEHEAKVLMMRLGYRNGREDAEFIRQGWPNLDIGDAFTAGTRLHMVTGTVRVETLHNDFDFKTDRFSGDFLWHQSVEAVEYQRRHGRALAPVCWAQTGYAAGYASVFFRKLVLYKEVSCAAMGDKSCRVVGKTVDGWGKDEPFVRMFLDEVLVNRAEMPSRLRKAAGKAEPMGSTRLEDRVVAPIRHELEKIAHAGLNALITGPEGAGCRMAADWLHVARFGHGKPHRCHATSPRLPALLDSLRQTISAPGARGQTLIIEGIDALADDLQVALIDMIKTDGIPPENLLVIGLSHLPLRLLRRDTALRSELIYALSVLPVTMPPLSARPDDIADLAACYLAQMRAKPGAEAPALTEEAKAFIRTVAWPGNLPELRATLMRAALCADAPPMIDRNDLDSSRLDPQPSAPSLSQGEDDFAELWDQLVPIFEAGIGLDTLVSRIEQRAVTDADGNVSAAARLLGLSRPKLDYRLKNPA